MKRETVHHLTDSIRKAPSSLVFQAFLATTFLVPLVATLGQFASSGFLMGNAPFLLIFWPGAEVRWAPSAPVWLTMGAMGASYLAGIWYLLRRRTLGKVVLWSIAAVIVANVIGSAVNRLTGWRELQTVASMALAGKVNAMIFSLWQNPIWEEIVFRGIPLLILLMIRKRWSGLTRWLEWGYIILPNIIFALYHIPGHGPSRIVDTLILGCGLSWLALRFTLFAPIVVHYLLDAMMVVSLSTLPNIPGDEIGWLVRNKEVLNSSWSLAVLGAVICPLVIISVNTIRGMKRPAGEVHSD